ncbi:MAG: hypothetical protein LBQ09_00960 [Acidobacteriaceae bacterium]|jgi:hypothetical protein|nr:hypothetical protein [Acidobacteriaceae bacterium]
MTWRETIMVAIVFVSLVTLRAWGVSTHFWLLGDQILLWGMALKPFSELPLIGSPTHLHGYEIGPAFWWILWATRVVIGPWVSNLPHAGGIGQAVLRSAADSVLCLAVWRRSESVAGALAAVILIATSAFDLMFASQIWNPPMAEALVTAALALVLLDWHRRGIVRLAVTCALAWAAIHAHMSAIFVTVAIFGAALVDPLRRGERWMALRNGLVIASVVGVLQLPYLFYQWQTSFAQPAMAVVSDSLLDVVTHKGATQFAVSAREYVDVVSRAQGRPWQTPWMVWVLLVSSAIVIVRYWRDTALLMVLVVPGVAVILGYALLQGDLDSYYYLPVLPVPVLTVVFAALAIPWRQPRAVVAVAMLVLALVMVPSRVRLSGTALRFPQYGALASGSRTVAQRHMAMRAIWASFELPPTCQPEFMYQILGGVLDQQSPWVAVIAEDGSVSYRDLDRELVH